eukprot:TRINITY_DN81_c0_g1_i1.p1 TRINITY_DN81_c0_g1~~TRINITY_DN81_c0_g1_i1.p1  ORF type:complete len:215 (+),score=7.60 TRINITY_DN81_c0_g1_i1:84-728(+)
MASRNLFCLLFFVVGCYCTCTPSGQGVVHPGKSFDFEVPSCSWRDVAVISVNSTRSLLLCINERYPVPLGAQFSNETCTEFRNLTAGYNREKFYLSNLPQYFGLAFAESGVTSDLNVSYSVEGAVCKPGQYGPLCNQALATKVGTVPVNIQQQDVYFELEVPVSVSQLTVSAKKEPVLRMTYEAHHFSQRMKMPRCFFAILVHPTLFTMRMVKV